MKKISITFLCLLMLFVFSYPVLASESENIEKSSINSSEAKAAIKRLEDDMNKAGVSKDKEASSGINIKATEQVNIGTNKTFTWANAGNSGCPDSNWAPLGSYAHGFGYAYMPGWTDAGSYVNFIGVVGSWGWVGEQIYVAGSQNQTRNARITFKGKYKGKLQVYPMGYATGKVRVSVFDITDNTEKGGTTVLEKTIGGVTLSPTYEGAINHSVNLSLKAGHTYVLRFGVASSADSRGKPPAVASSQFADSTNGQWTPGSGPYGVTFESVSVNWL